MITHPHPCEAANLQQRNQTFYDAEKNKNTMATFLFYLITFTQILLGAFWSKMAGNNL